MVTYKSFLDVIARDRATQVVLIPYVSLSLF